MATHANRVQMTVSGTPGTGTITLGSASSGYRTFASAYGANATVDVLIVDGTAWEVARGCAYTHSGTTLSRGTLESSSTGSAISLTSSAIVSVIATADSGRRWDAAALEHSTVTGTSGAISAAVNTLYVADMSGWTADRTLTLPATAAVGDRVGVMVNTGDADYEWLITAASGDTLNGVSGGTEWSRVLITGEVLVMRCITANTTWVVDYDGRIGEQFRAHADGTNQQNLSTGTGTTLVHGGSGGALKTVAYNVGGSFTQSSGIFFPRRAGRYQISASAVIDSMNDGKYMAVYISHSTDGSTWGESDNKSGICWRGASSAAGLVIGGSGEVTVDANGTNDRFSLRVFHSDAGTPKVPGTSTVPGWAVFSGIWIGDSLT